MNVSKTEYIRRAVKKLDTGAIVTANDFPKLSNNTVNKILMRLAEEGLLERIKRGIYSRCRQTRFGLAKATPLMVLSKEINNDDNKCFGGLFLLNQLGLTTQVPTLIEIINNKSSYQSKIGGARIRYVRIRPKINKRSKELIITLEVIKKIGKIPAGSIKKTIQWLENRLEMLSHRELVLLVKSTRDYSPRVRAILGSLLQEIDAVQSEWLKKTLNDNTYYYVGQAIEYLPSSDYWKLKE